MKILIDILHPAHVHFFSNFRTEMQAHGHDVLVTAREKDVAVPLLEKKGIEHVVLSQQKTGIGLGVELVSRTAKLLGVARRFKPDVMTGIMGPSIALAGRALNIPSAVFYDTEFAYQTNWFTYPLADVVCTPDCYRSRVRGNHVTYPGYHELAYLSPNRFSPDASKLKSFGVSADERFFVVRFVSWEAIHDQNETALTLEQKLNIIEELSKFGKVIIFAETELPPELEKLRARGDVNDVHHVMAFSELLVGESATMASEAAVLGTPAIFIAKSDRGYTEDQEKRYGLVAHFKTLEFDQAMQEMTRRLLLDHPKQVSAAARDKLLAEKIDVTDWMVEFFLDRYGRPSA